MAFIFLSTNYCLTFFTISRTSVALDPILLHIPCIFTFLFKKFSRIYLKEIRSRWKSLFYKMSLTGSKGSSNVSVVFLGEFDLDLILVFFLMQLLEFVFLIAGVFSPAQVNE